MKTQKLSSVLFTAVQQCIAYYRHSINVCWMNSIRAELDECSIENLPTLPNNWFCDLCQDI